MVRNLYFQTLGKSFCVIYYVKTTHCLLKNKYSSIYMILSNNRIFCLFKLNFKNCHIHVNLTKGHCTIIFKTKTKKIHSILYNTKTKV